MSSKEAAHRAPDEFAVRVRPVGHPWRWKPSWLGPNTAAVLVAFLGVAAFGAMYLALRDSGSFASRQLESLSPSQLNAEIASAQERLKIDPQDLSSLVELGTLHFQKGRDFYPDAINELEEARELGALDARIFYCLGIMYQELGLYPFAIEEYKRFLRHYPEDKETRLLEAKLLYRQGAYADAISEYERLKFHFPNDGLIEENLGLSLWGAKEMDRAVESFTALSATGGDQAKRAEFYLGQISFDKGDFKAALEHFGRCQPENGRAAAGIPLDKLYSYQAATYQKLGLIPEAKSAWEMVIKESPADSKAQAALKGLSRRVVARRYTAKKS